MVKRIIRFFADRILLKLNPDKYLKRLGVNTNGRVNLYGPRVGMFGTEPWLITIGKNVHITGNCQFVTHDGGTLILRHRQADLELTFPIIIGDNVYIGYGAIILPGVTIGDNVIIGAGSVVNKDIPSNSIAVGVPCKPIKTLEDYFEKAKRMSLKLGHLKGEDKNIQLKKFYNKL